MTTRIERAKALAIAAPKPVDDAVMRATLVVAMSRTSLQIAVNYSGISRGNFRMDVESAGFGEKWEKL